MVNDGCGGGGGGGGNNKRQGSNEETTRREQSVYPRPVELPITLEVVVIVKKVPSPISWDRNSFLFQREGRVDHEAAGRSKSMTDSSSCTKKLSRNTRAKKEDN